MKTGFRNLVRQDILPKEESETVHQLSTKMGFSSTTKSASFISLQNRNALILASDTVTDIILSDRLEIVTAATSATHPASARANECTPAKKDTEAHHAAVCRITASVRLLSTSQSTRPMRLLVEPNMDMNRPVKST